MKGGSSSAEPAVPQAAPVAYGVPQPQHTTFAPQPQYHTTAPLQSHGATIQGIASLPTVDGLSGVKCFTTLLGLSGLCILSSVQGICSLVALCQVGCCCGTTPELLAKVVGPSRCCCSLKCTTITAAIFATRTGTPPPAFAPTVPLARTGRTPAPRSTADRDHIRALTCVCTCVRAHVRRVFAVSMLATIPLSNIFDGVCGILVTDPQSEVGNAAFHAGLAAIEQGANEWQIAHPDQPEPVIATDEQQSSPLGWRFAFAFPADVCSMTTWTGVVGDASDGVLYPHPLTTIFHYVRLYLLGVNGAILFSAIGVLCSMSKARKSFESFRHGASAPLMYMP
jgi:hypothetical protein